MEIFKLFGSIFVNTDEAEKSISKTDNKASSFASTLGSGIKTAAAWGLGIASAAAAGTAALFKVATSAASTADDIDEMSQKIGISRQAYQELDFITSQCGASVDNMKAGMKTLTNQMQAASEGSKTATKVFDELGLSWEDGTGKLKDQETMMWEAFSALQNMDDQTKKAALATDLFGKSGSDLMPMLNGASGSIEEMKQQAHDLGIIMSDESVEAGGKLADTIEVVKQSFDAIVTKIGISFIPMLQTMLDWVLLHMPEIQSVMEIVFGVISLLVTTSGGIFQEVFTAIVSKLSETGITFNDVFDAIKLVFEALWIYYQTVWDLVGKPIFDLIMTVLGTVAGYFQQKMPEIKGFFEMAINDIVSIWNNNLKPCLEAIGNFISNVLAPAFQFVFKNIIAPVVDACFKGIANLWTGSLKPIFTGIIDFITGVFTGDWRKAWSGIVSIVEGIFNGMITVVKTPINAVIGIVNRFIDGLNTLKIPSWVPGIGGSGINIGHIPMLAKGGNISKAGKVMVGDAGPEILDLPVGARVTPLNGVQKNEFTSNNSNDTDLVERIYEILASYLPILASLKIVLDTGVLVGEIAPEIDSVLGEIASWKGRNS